jgi:uncharacterized protein YkwD
LRKLAALMAAPVVVPIRAASFVYRGIGSQIRVAIAALVVAAVGVLALAAPSGTTAVRPTVILPVTSAAVRTDLRVGQSLDATIAIAFTSPMNPVSVAQSLRVVPDLPVELSWDPSRTVLFVTPSEAWEPATLHTVTVDAGAVALTGAPISSPVRAAFLTRAARLASIAATKMIGAKTAPDSRFVLTFDGPVDPATVANALRFEPAVTGSIARLDRGGPSGYVFAPARASGSIVRLDRGGGLGYVFTPAAPLAPNATYRILLSATVRDNEGASVAPTTLSIRTADVPTVIRFRPSNGTRGMARTADISVRFSKPMDRASTKAAVMVTADGKAVAGTVRFADHDTVLVFHPKSPFKFGQQVVMSVAETAASATGTPLGTAVTGTFTTRAGARSTGVTAPIPIGGSVGGGTWAAVEAYYLKLMNCTRTGGWVTSKGECSSPGGRNVAPVWIDEGISSAVSRPYARLLATRGDCTHFIGGTPGDRLRRAGYTSYIWAENLGCRSGDPFKSVLGSHLFFQAERPYLGGHYVNLMNAKYDRVGLGVWVAGGRVRLVIDFYHPR